VAHTSQAGAETSRTKFEPYGYTAGGTKPGPAMAGVPTTGSAIGFTGHVNDPETDLVYMQQRYYDPIAGRFLSVDPVVTDADSGGSFNRYAYANNSPYKYVDPDGKNPAAVIAVGGATVLMIGAWKYATDPQARAVINRKLQEWRNRSEPKRNDSKEAPKSDGKNSGEGGKSTNPADILSPDGKPVGENVRGAKPGVQTVPPEQLTDIIDQLKGGGAQLDPNSRYPGDWYNLPNGQGGFGIRDSKDNGRSLDVNIPGVPDVTKIHQR
jgi:RHS repeat-associated protein